MFVNHFILDFLFSENYACFFDTSFLTKYLISYMNPRKKKKTFFSLETWLSSFKTFVDNRKKKSLDGSSF